MKVDTGRYIFAVLFCIAMGAVGAVVPLAVEEEQVNECPYDDPDCMQNGFVYYEDAPYGYDGYWQGGKGSRTDGGKRGRSDRRRSNGSRSDAGRRTHSTSYSTGPSYATMSRTPVSGGVMSGGHISGSMGAGATIGHGHR
jgi:hypothetical protein